MRKGETGQRERKRCECPLTILRAGSARWRARGRVHKRRVCGRRLRIGGAGGVDDRDCGRALELEGGKLEGGELEGRRAGGGELESKKRAYASWRAAREDGRCKRAVERAAA